MVRKIIRCSEPAARTMGNRRIKVSASSIARRSFWKASACFPGPASGNSADWRYFFPEKLDGCDARGPQHTHCGRYGSGISECAKGLSYSSSPHYPAICRWAFSCGGTRGKL